MHAADGKPPQQQNQSCHQKRGEQGAECRQTQGRAQHAAQFLPVAGQPPEEQNEHQGQLRDLIGLIQGEQLVVAAGQGIDIVAGEQAQQQHQEDAGHAQAGRDVLEQHSHQQQGPEDGEQKREGGTQRPGGKAADLA